MEFAVDPDGDVDPSDAVDVINMSLGSNYGQPFDDDLSQAVDNVTALGVLNVVAAGNGSDKPFVLASPSAAPTALSVAQTAVPSSFLPLMEITAPGTIAGLYETVFQPWSAPLAGVLAGPVQYGDGAGGGLDGCSTGPDPSVGPSPFPLGSLTGKIVLVDRGGCFFSTKIQNVEAGGGLVGIIGLVAPGDPFAGSFGAGPLPGIQGFMISQNDSLTIKSELGTGVAARFDLAVAVPLVMTMGGSSSRGPQYQDFRIKPEIGAPGASVSAEVGTGAGVTPFGGTSGATPMVAGSAALLIQAYPALSPAEVKARLMNTAETNIANEGGGPPAAISRIGSGEVRVDRAWAAPAAAWDDNDPSHPAALSFGFHEVSKKKARGIGKFKRPVIKKKVRVRNYSSSDIEYDVFASFRFADDEASGAVKIKVPKKVKVKDGNDKTFNVKIEIDGELLSGNFLHSGSGGANPSLLTAMEFDGYITLDDGVFPIHLPWHIIPRKAAKAKARPKHLKFDAGGVAEFKLKNKGVGTAQNDVYSLLGTSPDIPEGLPGEQNPTPDLRAVGVQTFPTGGCSAGYVLALASNNWERQTHAVAPASIQWWLDIDQNGVEDYVVLSRDFTFDNITDGRNLAWSLELATGNANAFFFTEHNTNTGNQVLYVCGEQIGSPAFFQNMDARVVAQDFYFGGNGDEIDGLTFSPLGERYLTFDPVALVLLPNIDLQHKEKTQVHVIDFGPLGTNPSEIGLMLVTNGDCGAGNRGAATEKTETLVLEVK